MSRHADLLIHGGPIYTMDPRQPSVEAVAVKAGRVQAVGRLSDLTPLQGADTTTHRLEGRTLLPGFNDAHVHIWKKGHLLTTMLDLSATRSLEDIRREVAGRVKDLAPGQWLLGRGYNEALLKEGRKPTQRDLNDLTPLNPVCLTRTCAHIHTVNARALELAGINRDTPDPPGGEIARGEDGEATGLLSETAYGSVQRVIPPFTKGELASMVRAGQEHLLSLGITSATDPAVDAPLYEVYRSLEAAGALAVRTNLLYLRRPDGGAETLPLPQKYRSDLLRCDTVKFFADGGLSGATAKLLEPYRNTERPTTGVLRFERAELYELALAAHRAGFRIGTHAIGDVAIEQVLSVYRELHEACPRPRLRHRIEHFGLPSEAHLRGAAALGVIAVPQAIFIGELGGNFLRYLPERYLPRCYPLRAMVDAGLSVALSSNGPVVRDLSPLSGIAAAVTRRVTALGELLAPEQAISVYEALYAYTVGGAVAQGDDGNRGSLEAGKWADLVVLSGDPLATPPEELHSLRVEATFVSGAVRFLRGA